MPAEAVPVMAAARSRTSDFVALTKPRLNLLVVATTAGGYFMGAAPAVTALGLLNVTLATVDRKSVV